MREVCPTTVLSLLRCGLDTVDIAKRLGVTEAEAANAIARGKAAESRSPPPNPGGFVWTPRRIARLARMWRAGISCAVIAHRLGTTARGVEGRAYRDGLPRRYAELRPGTGRLAVAETARAHA